LQFFSHFPLVFVWWPREATPAHQRVSSRRRTSSNYTPRQINRKTPLRRPQRQSVACANKKQRNIFHTKAMAKRQNLLVKWSVLMHVVPKVTSHTPWVQTGSAMPTVATPQLSLKTFGIYMKRYHWDHSGIFATSALVHRTMGISVKGASASKPKQKTMQMPNPSAIQASPLTVVGLNDLIVLSVPPFFALCSVDFRVGQHWGSCCNHSAFPLCEDKRVFALMSFLVAALGSWTGIFIYLAGLGMEPNPNSLLCESVTEAVVMYIFLVPTLLSYSSLGAFLWKPCLSF